MAGRFCPREGLERGRVLYYLGVVVTVRRNVGRKIVVVKVNNGRRRRGQLA